MTVKRKKKGGFSGGRTVTVAFSLCLLAVVTMIGMYTVGRTDQQQKELEQQVPSPMRVPFLDEMGSVFRAVKKRDILLHFPYQSFDYLIRFLMEAAFDPKVDEIKITQ